MPSSSPQPRPAAPATITPGRPVEVHSRAQRPLRITLAHDWLCGRRGGENVLEHLARIAIARRDSATGPPISLYIMFDDGRPMTSAINQLRRVASPLMRLPGALRLRRWLLPLYPAAVSALSAELAREHAREPMDLLISTSSAAVKGIRPPKGVPHVCYCHSPARYVWSQSDEYAKTGRLTSLGLSLYGPRFKTWDRDTSATVTTFLANSNHTAGQIQLCFQRGSQVVHPPADTEYFTPAPHITRQDFWLVVGALEPYKRTDLAIATALRAGKKLVVVGTGSLGDELQRRTELTAPRGAIEFRGRVSNAELRDLYRRAELLLFPQLEDFGIIAVEALACGLPVIARRAGGALDIIDDGLTGAFFDDPTTESLLSVARAFCTSINSHTASLCREKASAFSALRFERAINAVIDAHTEAPAGSLV